MNVNSWKVNNAGVSAVIMDAESFTSLKLKSGEVSLLPDSGFQQKIYAYCIHQGF